jgi:type III secretion protein T
VISIFEADELLRSLILGAPRIAAAFLILPILSREDAPPLVRNTIYVALAVAVTPFITQAAALPRDFEPWVGLIVKEIFVGAVIGFSFASVLWAVGMAGDIIDTKVGTSMATVIDPLAGHQTSLSGALLSRFANYVFLAVGGLTIFLDLLLGSYAVWPVQAPFPAMDLRGVEYFARSFGSMMLLAFMLAAPAMILMSMIDLALGVMNRYAPNLNVLPIAMALKSWLASGILLLGLTTFMAVMVQSFDRGRGILDTLARLFAAG